MEHARRHPCLDETQVINTARLQKPLLFDPGSDRRESHGRGAYVDAWDPGSVDYQPDDCSPDESSVGKERALQSAPQQHIGHGNALCSSIYSYDGPECDEEQCAVYASSSTYRETALASSYLDVAGRAVRVSPRKSPSRRKRERRRRRRRGVSFHGRERHKASDRTPLKMKWPQFVWLALALGASARDPAWLSGYPCTLKKSECQDFIHLFFEEDRLFAKVALRSKLTYFFGGLLLGITSSLMAINCYLWDMMKASKFAWTR